MFCVRPNRSSSIVFYQSHLRRIVPRQTRSRSDSGSRSRGYEASTVAFLLQVRYQDIRRVVDRFDVDVKHLVVILRRHVVCALPGISALDLTRFASHDWTRLVSIRPPSIVDHTVQLAILLVDKLLDALPICFLRHVDQVEFCTELLGRLLADLLDKVGNDDLGALCNKFLDNALPVRSNER